MGGNRFSRRTFLAGSSAVVAACTARGQTATGVEKTMGDERVLNIPVYYYQHFDADYALDVPEEGFGGWKRETLPFSRDHTALVVMHAWDAGTREDFPGWWRCVPYIPRANVIAEKVFPPLLAAVRNSGLPLFHVVGGGDYYKNLPGYKRAVELAGPAPAEPEKISSDLVLDRLREFRDDHVFVGAHNAKDVSRGFARLDFPGPARPVGDEGVAENGHQLFALCKEKGVNHLVYVGFAINWCLLLSPGGMAEMAHRHGMMCSTIRQATTAVENKESARKEWCKELALWRTALAFGFVFDLDDFTGALKA